MIQVFVLVAVALGIASTLAISAVQKTRQIGILKAMGMKDRQSGRIFLWQALILGVVGVAGRRRRRARCSSPSSRSQAATTRVPDHAEPGFVVDLRVHRRARGAALVAHPVAPHVALDPIEVIQGG